MQTYLIRRLIEGALTIFGVITLTFLIIKMLPGDAVLTILYFAPKEYVEQMRHALGLDQPILAQYVNWIVPLVTRLDLGHGITINDSVANLLRTRMPVTMELAFLSMLLATTISLPLGLLAARNRGSWMDYIAMQFSQLCQALPELWIATLLFFFLGVKLRILPSGGWVPISENIGLHFQSMIMPAISLALPVAGILTRIVRSSMLEVLSKDYVTTAYAKGLKRTTVMSRHVLRNALLPLLTMLGVEMGYLMGGSVIIEDIFLLPGIGKLAVTALSNRDVPVIQGVLVFYASFFVMINIVVDVLYAVVDPRVSYD